MDEFKIKSGLVFTKRNGKLVGFIDLGSVNRDIEQLAADDTMSADSPSAGQLANQMSWPCRAVFKTLTNSASFSLPQYESHW